MFELCPFFIATANKPTIEMTQEKRHRMVDLSSIPRFAGIKTFMRLPHEQRVKGSDFIVFEYLKRIAATKKSNRHTRV